MNTAVDLPLPRDQLSTRQLREFVRLRSEIASLLLRRAELRDEVLVCCVRSSEPAAGASRTARHARAAVKGLVGALVFGVIWQLLADRHFVLPQYFPTATTTFRDVFHVLGQADFRSAIVSTLREMLEGLAISTLIGVPAGVVIGRSQHAYRATRLLVELLRPISAVALAPLAILVFKTGLAPVIFLVVWTSVWPILINTIYGMRDLDPVAQDTARVFGFGRLAILFRVALPNGASYVATGIRISTGIALAVAIAGEIVAGGGQGIGGWINKESSAGSLVSVYAGALIVGLIGYLLNLGLERVERRALHWHESLRTEHGS